MSLARSIQYLLDNWNDYFSEIFLLISSIFSLPGKRITSCTARGSSYYIVMTKNVNQYHGKRQVFLRKKYWQNMDAKISQYWNNGFAITGICYNHGLSEYLVIMTKSNASQSYGWFEPSEESEQFNWEFEEYYEEKKHATIYFLNPNDDQLLVVCTSDKNRSGFKTPFSIRKQALMNP